MRVTFNYKFIKRFLLFIIFILIVLFGKRFFLLETYALTSSVSMNYDSQGPNLDYSLGNSWVNWGDGTLTFDFGMYDFTMDSTHALTQTPSAVYITADNTDFNCTVTGTVNTQQGYEEINAGGIYGLFPTYSTAFYSASCKLTSGSVGVQSIHIRGFGDRPNSHWRLNGPVSFTQDDTSTIVNNQNQNTDRIVNGQTAINNSINDDNVSGADSTAGDFFSDFQTTDHNGISGIITSPMRLIQALSGNSCSSLTIPLPFVEEDIVLPCMSSIYSTYFPTFLTFYRIITTGIIAYWVVINLFAWIRRLERPDDDRIEVLNL